MPYQRFPHILLPDHPKTSRFTSTKQGGKIGHIPPRNRGGHADYLKKQLDEAWQEAKNEAVVYKTDRRGVYLEFRGSPGYDLMTKSLEDFSGKDKEKVRLCNVRIENESIKNEITGKLEEMPVTYATVFVHYDMLKFFLDKIEKYLNENRKSGKPLNADLIESIDNIRKALLIESFWPEKDTPIPDNESEWCEVWLRSNKEEVIERFDKLLDKLEINSKPGKIVFPEQTVKLVYVNRDQLSEITRRSDDIAEYRKAKETAAFWTEMPNREQAEWVEDLKERLYVNKESLISVCILDTGVNNGHPLLSPILDDSDCQNYNSQWGKHDKAGHGTLMAGISGFGNLMDKLSTSEPVVIEHKLESVKILPNKGENPPELWGDITSQGVSLAEIQAPYRKRTFCMAVTATDTRERGRPSS